MINDAGEVIPGARKLAYSQRTYIEGEDPNAAVFNKLSHFFPPVNVKAALGNGIAPETLAAIEAIRRSLPEPVALKNYFTFDFDVAEERYSQYRICASHNDVQISYTLCAEDDTKEVISSSDKKPSENLMHLQITGYLNEMYLVCMDMLEANEPWKNILGEYLSALAAMKSRESCIKLNKNQAFYDKNAPAITPLLQMMLGGFKNIQGLSAIGILGDVLQYDSDNDCLNVDLEHPRNRFIGVMQRFSCRLSWFYSGVSVGRKQFRLEDSEHIKSLIRILFACKSLAPAQVALHLSNDHDYLPKAALTWAKKQLGIKDTKPASPPPKKDKSTNDELSLGLFVHYLTDKPEHLGNIEFYGSDYRNGKDVDEHDFINTFGFRGVQFGNWLSQKERQVVVNMAYDSFYRISEVLRLSSPKLISLGGKLAIAFGARGTSKAMAHYESSLHVVNLTKMRGAGSLFHEYVHAIDNISYLHLDRHSLLVPEHKLDIEKPFLSHYAHDKLANESTIPLQQAFAILNNAIAHAEDHKPITKAYMIAIFMCDRVITQHAHQASHDKMKSLKRWMHEEYLPRVDPNIKQWNPEYQAILKKTKECLGFVNRVPVRKINSIIHSTKQNITHFEWNAILLDKGRHKSYWSSPQELYARAFEAFIHRHFDLTNQRTDYLVHGVESTMTYPQFWKLNSDDFNLYSYSVFELLGSQIESISQG